MQLLNWATTELLICINKFPKMSSCLFPVFKGPLFTHDYSHFFGLGLEWEMGLVGSAPLGLFRFPFGFWTLTSVPRRLPLFVENVSGWSWCHMDEVLRKGPVL